MFKVASADLVDYQLHKYLASTFKPIIISTGMGSMEEIEDAIHILRKSDLTILHCVSDYPLNPLNANLSPFLLLEKMRFAKLSYQQLDRF